jgi:hypothetical protein
MLTVFTIRDFLWLMLVGWVSLSWQLDIQVKDLEVADSQDTVSLFREDNAILERELFRHQARISQLEARPAMQPQPGSL